MNYLGVFIFIVSLTHLVFCQLSAKSVYEFQQTIFDAHNEYRRLHGVGDLIQNKTINEIALNYSIKLVEIGDIVHSNREEFGENLYVAYNLDYTFINDMPGFARECIGDWYNEIDKYDFAKGVYSPEVGHFTQLIWKTTSQVGCGVAIGNKTIDGANYLGAYCVCDYFEPGNYEDEFIDNVLPRVKSPLEEKIKEALTLYGQLVSFLKDLVS